MQEALMTRTCAYISDGKTQISCLQCECSRMIYQTMQSNLKSNHDFFTFRYNNIVKYIKFQKVANAYSTAY